MARPVRLLLFSVPWLLLPILILHLGLPLPLASPPVKPAPSTDPFERFDRRWKERVERGESSRPTWEAFMRADSLADQATMIAQFGQALEGARSDADRWGEARLSFALGRATLAAGNDAVALAAAQRASELLADLPDTEREQATAIALQGRALLYQGDAKAARPVLERALAIREKVLGPEHVDVAASLNALGLLFEHQGDYAAAERHLEHALAIRERALGLEHREIAGTLAVLGRILEAQGDYAGARPVLERALAIMEKALGPEHREVAYSLNALGNLLYHQGEYAAARALHDRALAVREKAFGPDHFDVATSCNDLAAVLYEQGDFAAARPLFERALAIRERTGGPEHPLVAQTLNNLAELHLEQGDAAAAQSFCERALAIREKILGPEHPLVGTTVLNLAQIFYRQEDYPHARALYERSLAIYARALGPDHPNLGRSLRGLAFLHHEQGDFAAAERAFERAIAIQERALGTQHPEVAESLTGLAGLLRDRGRLAAARHAALRAHALKLHVWDDLAPISSERQALLYAGEVWAPLSMLLSSIGPESDAGTLSSAYGAVAKTRGVVVDRLADRQRFGFEAETPEMRQAFATYRRSRQRLANLVGGESDDPSHYRKQVADAQAETEAAERKLAAVSQTFASERELRRQERALSSSVLSQLLPLGACLVEYVRYEMPAPGVQHPGAPGSTVLAEGVFVLRQGRPNPVFRALGPASTTDSLVARYRALVERPLASAFEDVSRALYDRLWAPIEPLLADSGLASGPIFVVPEGSLHLLAFGTLITPRQRFLIEEHPLHLLTASRDLLRLAAKRPTRGGLEATGRGLLALGDPDFDLAAPARREVRAGGVQPARLESLPHAAARAAPPPKSTGLWQPGPLRGASPDQAKLAEIHLDRLPETGPEVTEIAALCRERLGEEATVLLGAQALEDALKELAPGRRMLHLATHGFFLGGRAAGDVRQVQGWDNPLLLSGLFLTGANRHGEGAAGAGVEDGIVTAEELATLDLRGTDWVVLSACETGLGEVQLGEGVFGLRRALQIAGARTTIMSLWRVPDEETRRFMRHLYQARLAGLGTAAALRQATLETLKATREASGTDHRYQRYRPDHPFTWGSFVAAGGWD